MSLNFPMDFADPAPTVLLGVKAGTPNVPANAEVGVTGLAVMAAGDVPAGRGALGIESTLLSGAADPQSTDGVDGDFWLRTDTTVLFGPKASGAWPTPGVSLARLSANNTWTGANTFEDIRAPKGVAKSQGFGEGALASNTTGIQNTASGYQALFSNTEGYNNTASGYQALYSNTTGIQNTASGSFALFSNTTGNDNTASGYAALYFNTEGYNNTASGLRALRNNTTGIQNTASGYQALFSNTEGYNNTASGSFALFSNTTGNDNTASGVNALYGNTTGSNNTASGFQALFSNTTGYNNTVIGVNAGGLTNEEEPANAINNCVLLGYNIIVSAATDTNEIVIGSEARGNGSNTVTIGNSSITATYLRGKLNIQNMPTSSAGLASGDVWSDGGTLKIV